MITSGLSANKRSQRQEILHQVVAIANKLELPENVKERARTVLKEAATSALCEDRSASVLAAATLYLGCRESKMPITLRELGNAIGVDRREVGRCYMSLIQRMHISRPGLNGKTYVQHLELEKQPSDMAVKLSREIIRKASEKGLGGRNPMTLAASALYLACCSVGERVTLAELAKGAGVSPLSVGQCSKAIRGLVPLPATEMV